MPKRKPPRTYNIDNGYIVANDEDVAVPASKKKKSGGALKSGGDGEMTGVGKEGEMGKGKKEGAGGSGGQKGKGKGKDGEEFWELTSKRRVGISEFKGNLMISIREYYEKDGEVLPGKKGISLPIEQFNTLIKHLPDIESALAEKNQSVSRPDYSGAGASAAVEDDEEEEDEEMEREGKKNFEETSDEE